MNSFHSVQTLRNEINQLSFLPTYFERHHFDTKVCCCAKMVIDFFATCDVALGMVGFKRMVMDGGPDFFNGKIKYCVVGNIQI